MGTVPPAEPALSSAPPEPLRRMPHFSQNTLDVCICIPQLGQYTREPLSLLMGSTLGRVRAEEAVSPAALFSAGSSTEGSGGTGVPHSMQN